MISSAGGVSAWRLCIALASLSLIKGSLEYQKAEQNRDQMELDWEWCCKHLAIDAASRNLNLTR